jgi:uncharacterized repeat protein (TIGR01451 family)
VIDDKVPAIDVSTAPATLAPGESFTVYGTYTITQADLDAGKVVNVAYATGTHEGATVTSPNDDEVVSSLPKPALALLKAADPKTYDGAGDVIGYTYTLTNIGNVTLIGPFTVDDDKTVTSPVGLPVMSLAHGASIDFEASYIITQADLDAGSVKNIAQGHGFFGQTPVHSNQDDETVTADQKPAIGIVKTADPLTYDSVGDVITYTYVVTNTGNVTLKAPFTVTDDKLGAVDVTEAPATLAPGASFTAEATHSITQADLDAGSIANVAFATGTFGDKIVSSPDDDAVVTADQKPAIAVEKKASAEEVELGTPVPYTYKVTNTGNVTLTGVTLNDDKLGPITLSVATLAPGESTTAEMKDVVLDESTTNIATAEGYGPKEQKVTATAEEFVDVYLPFTPVPDVTVDKSADKAEAKAGETVKYTLTYKNVGDAKSEATDIKIVDDFDERYVEIVDAADGTVENGKITWTFDGPLTPEDGPQTITYTVKISEDLPEDVKVVRNTVVISSPDETNTDNNTDTWDVEVPDEPFLPFTGGEFALIVFIAGVALIAGASLRRLARQKA